MATKHPSFTSFAKGVVINEADVEVVGASFEMWDYGGKRRDSIPAFHIKLKTTGGDVYDQYYSVGSADDYAPTKDGRTLDVLSDRERIHEQSNFAHFMEALLKAGFPEKRVDNDDIGCLVGTQGHVKQTTVKRTGTNVQSETNVLVFDKVTALPGEGGSGAATAGADGGEARDKATAFMLELLGDNDGSIERKSIMSKFIKSTTYKGMKADERAVVLNLIKSEDFITGSEDWTAEDGVVTLK